MDTAGLLARDPRVWADAIEVLYSGTIQNHTDFPSTVFVNAEDLPGTDEEYQAKVEDIYWKFGLDLASAIGANVTNFTNLDVTWNKTRPAEFNDTQLFNIYNPVYRSLVVYEQATTFGLPFLADYKSTHNGALPYVAPQTLNGWESSVQTVNETRHRALLSQKAAIARWAADHLFKADPASCADSLLITYYGPGFDAKPAISDACVPSPLPPPAINDQSFTEKLTQPTQKRPQPLRRRRLRPSLPAHHRPPRLPQQHHHLRRLGLRIGGRHLAPRQHRRPAHVDRHARRLRLRRQLHVLERYAAEAAAAVLGGADDAQGVRFRAEPGGAGVGGAGGGADGGGRGERGVWWGGRAVMLPVCVADCKNRVERVVGVCVCGGGGGGGGNECCGRDLT